MRVRNSHFTPAHSLKECNSRLFGSSAEDELNNLDEAVRGKDELSGSNLVVLAHIAGRES